MNGRISFAAVIASLAYSLTVNAEPVADSPVPADTLLGPDLFGVRIGMPFKPDWQTRPADLEIDSALTIQVSPLIGENSGVVSGFNIHHACTDLGECTLIAGTIVERLRGQGYPAARIETPSDRHLYEWKFESASFWLSVGVWREPERDTLTFSTWVWQHSN